MELIEKAEFISKTISEILDKEFDVILPSEGKTIRKFEIHQILNKEEMAAGDEHIIFDINRRLITPSLGQPRLSNDSIRQGLESALKTIDFSVDKTHEIYLFNGKIKIKEAIR
ncbi:hypothetical protein KHX94_18710 [Shewanella dokdonensis]|uniref:Uncharacterized protein n=2 Tax=Shewanella dokdonensis TaxID=712036 RepID=A0ABX8DEI1_9GAMM|nr:hypothetical protein [Shewanella dokdonensis]QVK23100.1 hypothetical protein KHX94_18710 [Shewanella dokdonensis]